MINGLNKLGKERALLLFADWTDRIAAASCRRRRRARRASSATSSSRMWDWADPKAYLHDVVSTDRRNPTRQRQRPALRRARAERRLPAGARSEDAHASARFR